MENEKPEVTQLLTKLLEASQRLETRLEREMLKMRVEVLEGDMRRHKLQ